MRDMGGGLWDVPRTKEGLQTALRQLEERRIAGDLAQVGYGLLTISYLVKWVGSDNGDPPMDRSHDLAVEALQTFRQTDDRGGQIQAMVSVSSWAGQPEAASLLSEAQSLAEDFGEDQYIALVLMTQGISAGGPQTDRIHKLLRAVEIFHQLGDKSSEARCHFSLSLIGDGSDEEKRDRALQAALLYRELGERNASLCMSWAFTCAEQAEPLVNLKELAELGLQIAQEIDTPSGTATFHYKLALIAAQTGDMEAAQTHFVEATDLNKLQTDDDPVEEWRRVIKMANKMVNTVKPKERQFFREALKRLKASKPKTDRS